MKYKFFKEHTLKAQCSLLFKLHRRMPLAPSTLIKCLGLFMHLLHAYPFSTLNIGRVQCVQSQYHRTHTRGYIIPSCSLLRRAIAATNCGIIYSNRWSNIYKSPPRTLLDPASLYHQNRASGRSLMREIKWIQHAYIYTFANDLAFPHKWMIMVMEKSAIC